MNGKQDIKEKQQQIQDMVEIDKIFIKFRLFFKILAIYNEFYHFKCLLINLKIQAEEKIEKELVY